MSWRGSWFTEVEQQPSITQILLENGVADDSRLDVRGESPLVELLRGLYLLRHLRRLQVRECLVVCRFLADSFFVALSQTMIS